MTVNALPRTWAAAQVLARQPDALVVAGGTGVQPWLTTSGAEPDVLVHLRHIEGAHDVVPAGTGIRLGAMVPVAHPALAPWFGADGAHWFATPAVRRRATVVGNTVSRFGPRELGPLLVAVGAEVGLSAEMQAEKGRPVIDLLSKGLPRGSLAAWLTLRRPDRISYHRATQRSRLSRVDVGVCAAVGGGCGAAVVMGHGGVPRQIDTTEGLLTNSRGSGDFVAAVRDSVPDAAGATVAIVTALAERVYRDLHTGEVG